MRFLITAGPTREPIDPVRYLTNRSSGKMGFALAEAAIESGHEVTLIAGPVQIPDLDGCDRVDVETAHEMFEAVAKEIGSADVAIFCAAVADYRPKEIDSEKIKKSGETLTLELVKTRDILGSARSELHFSGILVGFAAETNDLEKHSVEKLKKKGCDLLVANDVSRSDIGFDRDENAVTIFSKDGSKEEIDVRAKLGIARHVVARVEAIANE